jgi:hypothetical protein
MTETSLAPLAAEAAGIAFPELCRRSSSSPSSGRRMSVRGRAAPDVVVLDIGEVVIDETRVWSVWAELLGVSPATLMAVLGAAVVAGR